MVSVFNKSFCYILWRPTPRLYDDSLSSYAYHYVYLPILHVTLSLALDATSQCGLGVFTSHRHQILSSLFEHGSSPNRLSSLTITPGRLIGGLSTTFPITPYPG